MVLIFSSSDDYSTNDVIDWLNYFKQPVLRINPEDTLKVHSHYTLSNSVKTSEICLNNKLYDIEEFRTLWYRRGGIKKIDFLEKFEVNKILFTELETITINEWNSISEYLFYLLKDKPAVGRFRGHIANKISFLVAAKEAGLKIPNTEVCTTKEQVSNFKDDNCDIVIKPIQDTFRVVAGFNDFYQSYTEILTDKLISDMKDNFFPICVQELLEKKVEVRTFYLNGKSYSMAIFSQLDEQTTVDFRKYNSKKPNRVVPFKLPSEMELKIDKFMKSVNLNCGSLDIIYTPQKEFYFLEVNPVGQYGMVSTPCNYNLDKLIAIYLKDGK